MKEENMKSIIIKCCLCQDDIKVEGKDWGGHNPEPVQTDCEGLHTNDVYDYETWGCRCCSKCNENTVIPTRFAFLSSRN